MRETSRERASVGRPRLYDDDTERRMLVEAAVRLMAEKDESSISVADVLNEAGLSTRAFYRHFDSKEALFEALMIREAEAVGRSLARVVAQAPDPVSAVEAWLDRYLDVFYEPRRARRAAQLQAATARGGRPSARLLQEMRRISCKPLTEALRAGHEAGVLYSPTPEADAFSIYALITSRHEAVDGEKADRAAAKSHVLRFAWRAIGLESDRKSRPGRRVSRARPG